ncbi:MAG: SAM-dependent methyltransferase [Oligoflexia bacterium]|nr:MAG: SAM-dependent methyltransferase [Oligoflexia bacterium]
MTIWKLRPGADKRVRAHHPWVFSNELQQSPKGHPPGEPVRLVDHKGQFLAAGYGNPHSLISFRALSFDPHVQDPTSLEEIISQVISCWGHRSVLGYHLSFRLCYGENDYLPGLVLDRYVIEDQGQQSQVFAVQILTAGMQFALSDLNRFFNRLVEESVAAKLSSFGWDETSVVIRNDVQIRRLEGLEVEPVKVLHQGQKANLNHAQILIHPAVGEAPIKMACDLIEGQKTGFFLDQAYNIKLLCDQIMKSTQFESPVRILDLCCYVGQWSTQLARALKEKGLSVEVTAVDVSETALAFAKENIEREGAQAIIMKKDVLEELNSLPDKHYDIVIADPPAFIKAKKDVPTGRHAYLKMNTHAFRLVQRGGFVVSCSCSGLFEEKEMMEVLGKAIRRMDLRARCICRGGHAADHPNLMSFPEGFYLKMFIHQVEY